MKKQQKLPKDFDFRERLGILDTNNPDGLLRYYQLCDFYRGRLEAISISAFDWKGLPDEIDISILEALLMGYGKVAFLYDEICKKFFTFPVMQINEYDVYGRPLVYVAKSLYRNISFKCHVGKAPIIYDTSCINMQIQTVIEVYAQRLALARMTLDSNMNTLRTPYIITAENNRVMLSLKNLFRDIKNFSNVNYVNLDNAGKSFDENIKVLNLGVQDCLQSTREEYNALWNEALTAIGIPNISGFKKERMLTDEVNRSMAGAIASQYPRLQPRMKGCKDIERIFVLEPNVSYREGFAESVRKEGELDGTLYRTFEDSVRE